MFLKIQPLEVVYLVYPQPQTTPIYKIEKYIMFLKMPPLAAVFLVNPQPQTAPIYKIPKSK